VSDPGARAPAGWYPDPEIQGGQRYFDGSTWTEHRIPPPMPHPLPPYPPVSYPPMPHQGYGWWGPPSWKGAQLGRPPAGPGALAAPARRLGARFLDGLVLLPLYIALAVVAVALVLPHAGPLLPRTNTNPNSPQPVPGLIWIYLTLLGSVLATGLLWIAYETIATARYGRTLGKAWLRIRPLRYDGSALGWGRSFGRIACYWASGFLNWIGLLDPLWCLWDDNRQCLHDKVVDTIVVNDSVSAENTHAQSQNTRASDSTMPWSPAAPWTGAPYPQPRSQYWSPYTYGYPGFVDAARNNGLAVASLVCSLAGILFIGLPAVVGVIFGFVARSQIRRSNGTQTGSGLALAGIIVGLVVVCFWVLIFVNSAVFGHHSNSQVATPPIW